MPRNSNGNYSLPSGNPVSPNTLIESLWANTTLADVGQALTESLDRYGRGTMLAAFRVADGVVTAPGVAFGSEASTGIYRSGAGVMGLAVLGVAKATLTASAFTFNTAPTWAADPASANQLTRKTYVDNAIATAGGAFLPLTGGTLTGALNVGIAGTAAAPALRLNDDNTGLYQVAANEIGFATGGIHRVTINVSGISGAGSGLTALNASNLASGTVADARISGAYTGLTNITASGTVTAGKFSGAAGTAAAPSLSFVGEADKGMYSNGAGAIGLATAGLQRASISSSGLALSVPVQVTAGTSEMLEIIRIASANNSHIKYSGTGSNPVWAGLGIDGVWAVGVDSNLSTFTNRLFQVADAGIVARRTLQTPLGTAALPGLTFDGDLDTGIFRPASNVWAVAAGGVEALRLDSGGAQVSGALSATSFSGSGSGLTALNASNLSSGTVPDARISGPYSGISTLTLTDQLRLPAGAAATPSLRWLGAVNAGIYAPAVGQVAIVTSGADRLLTKDGGVDVTGALAVSGAITGASFSGSGSGLTSLNASNLSSGTVPNARISGALSGITTLTASGLITGGSFSGSGAALTALDASNLSSGTIASARVAGAYSGITAINSDATIGGFDVGYRGMPIVSRNSTTAFALTDAGKAIRKSNTTAYTWTISPDATTNFEIGAIVFLLHDSTAGNITVARGSGVALVEGTTDANVTLTAGERASIHKVAANRWRLYR